MAPCSQHTLINTKKKKNMTLGWVDDGEKTPRWAVGGIDPPRRINTRFRGQDSKKCNLVWQHGMV
jgi:hypothetical protein